MEIKNLKKAADRILDAVKNKEKIIIYGDADLDGTSSVVILKEAIEELNGKVSAVYFVDREKEGYGINEMGLDFLKPLAPALLIGLDLGITNFKEIEIANRLGFEVIIIDHHKVIGSLPKASIIVDPKQKEDEYPFKEFAATGLVYELVKVMLKDKMSDSLDNQFLELVALATIADMMIREKENKEYIEKGLWSLRYTKRLGLKVFFEMPFLKSLKESEKIQKIVSALNVSEIKEHLTEAFLLLTCEDKRKAKNLAEKFLDRNETRHFQIREITSQIEEKISENPCSVIFEGDTGWTNILNGSVASRICNKYKKPTFIYKRGKEKTTGAVRMPSGMDAVQAMQSCEKLLITFGGHAPAAGFTIKNENLEKFRECLIKYFEKL